MNLLRPELLDLKRSNIVEINQSEVLMTAVFNESYATVREFYPGFMTLRHALSLSQELR